MTDPNNTASAAAAAYIARGWAVIPLHDVAAGECSCGSADEPRHSPSQGGKHPLWGGWQNAGIRDVAVAASVWAGRPQANLGIVTGRASGLWVLDVDPDHGGDQRLVELIQANGPLPLTRTVQTGSGGRHYYFAMPDFDFTTSRGRLPAGLDVRGNAGQVVAPPSWTLKGEYRVLADPGVVAAPGWLLDLIRPAPARESVAAGVAPAWEGRGSEYAVAAVRALLAELAAAVPGTRNETAYRVGRRLAELVNSPWAGLGDGSAVADAFMAAAAACDVDGGFSQTEAADVLNKAIRAQAGRGADLPEATFYGQVWTPPVPVFPPGMSGNGNIDVGNVDSSGNISPGAQGAGGSASDFDHAGQDPAANPFSTPGMRTSTDVAAPLINEYAEQPKRQDPWEDAVSREVSRLLVRREAEKRVAAWGVPPIDFDCEALDAAGLSVIPELEPLVDGHLYADTLARINGPSGHGKSFVAVDLVCCVGSGRRWHGYDVRAAPALIVVAEGAAGMRSRIAAWQIRHEVADDALGVTFLTRAVQIGGVRWPAFLDWCLSRRFGLIVFDTQARSTVGRKENDATEMGEVVAALDELRERTRACVTLIHHRGKTGDEGRGSSAMKGAMDTEMDVSRNGSTVTLKVTKAKDRAQETPIQFTMNSCGDSLVLVSDRDTLTPGSPFVAPSVQLTGQERAALAIAQALVDAAGSGLTRAEAQTHARVSMGLPATDTVKKMIRRAWSDLMNLGRLAKADGREAYFWIEVEGLERLVPNPDKAVQGGPERYVP